MTVGHDQDEAMEARLDAWGAGGIAHLGGTLLAHVQRTREQLASWDAAPALVMAGLCHACYGTDGFGVALLDVSQRSELRAMIGDEAEAIVYRYASCDREFLYGRLGHEERPRFRDRWTGEVMVLDRSALGSLMELTFANELDLVRTNPSFAAEHGPGIAELFRRGLAYVSPAAAATFDELLGSA